MPKQVTLSDELLAHLKSLAEDTDPYIDTEDYEYEDCVLDEEMQEWGQSNGKILLAREILDSLGIDYNHPVPENDEDEDEDEGE